MIQQRLEGQKITPIKGILTIAGLAVSIIVLSWVERAIDIATGSHILRFAVWIVLLLEIIWIFRRSYQCFRYTVTEDRFIVERIYGDQGRIVFNIPLDHVIAFDKKSAVFKTHGNGQTYESAVIRGAHIPHMALAYTDEHADQSRLLVIQPDEAVRAALTKGVDAAKKPDQTQKPE